MYHYCYFTYTNNQLKISYDYSKYIVSSHMFDLGERLKFSYFHNNNLSSILIEQ